MKKTKYKSSTKEGKCIFCEIANKNIQTPGLFWEDKKFIAVLSIHPNTKGFTVLIPKKHYGSDVLNMPNKELQKFILKYANDEKLSKKIEATFSGEKEPDNHIFLKLYPYDGEAPNE